MDSSSPEGSPNTVQNSQNSQRNSHPPNHFPDPTKNLNGHFESVAYQKSESISELNKRGSMPSILQNSHLDHLMADTDEILVGEDDDFVFEVESPKLSNKMQMILQSNVNLSESIIQNTFKAVDASRIKLEDRDLQVELEITELKLHHLEKKLEGCLHSSKSTLAMNAKLSENVSKILHSPGRHTKSMNLPEIKPRNSDQKMSPKTVSAINNIPLPPNQFFRSAQGINSTSSPPHSNSKPTVDRNTEKVEKIEEQEKSEQKREGVEARTFTGTSIENNVKKDAQGQDQNLEKYLDTLKNNPYYFTFNQNQGKVAEEMIKSVPSDVLQASITDESELYKKAKNVTETKKMALPGLNFNSLPQNQQVPQNVNKPAPENNVYINTQDNVSLDYSEYTTQNYQAPSETLFTKQDQDPLAQLTSHGQGQYYGRQEVILEDANKNPIVYILKPKEILSIEKLETISVFFQAQPEHGNKGVTLNVPQTHTQAAKTTFHGVESEVEPLFTHENITLSSPAKTKLSVIRETGQNNSFSQDSGSGAAAENALEAQDQIVVSEDNHAMNLKLQLLNHPRCQKLLYGDDQYTVSGRGCSILQNRLETFESGKKVTNRSEAYFRQKVHDFKNFLNEFEELLSAEHLYSPGKPSQIHHKRINSCDSQRLNSGEAKVLDNILDKYFSGSAPITANETVIHHHQQYQEHQEQQATQEETPAPTQVPTQTEQIVTEEIQQQAPVKEKKLKKKRSLGPGEKKTKGTKQPKVILNTSNLSSMTDLVKDTNSAVQSPAQKVQQSPLDKILSGSSSLTFKHLDMITNPNLMKAGPNHSIKSDSNVNFESTLKDTRKNSEVSSHFAETEVKSPTEAIVDYSQFSKFTKNPRSVSFASGKSSSMKTLPEHPIETQESKKTLSKSKTTTSKSKITAKSSPKKSAATSSKPRSNSKKEAKSAATPTAGKLDVLSLLKPTTKKAKF